MQYDDEEARLRQAIEAQGGVEALAADPRAMAAVADRLGVGTQLTLHKVGPGGGGRGGRVAGGGEREAPWQVSSQAGAELPVAAHSSAWTCSSRCTSWGVPRGSSHGGSAKCYRCLTWDLCG